MPNVYRTITSICGLTIFFATPAYADETPTRPTTETQHLFVSDATERFAADTSRWQPKHCANDGLRAGAYLTSTGSQTNHFNGLVTYAAYSFLLGTTQVDRSACKNEPLRSSRMGGFILLAQPKTK